MQIYTFFSEYNYSMIIFFCINISAKVRISERKTKENTKFFHFAFPSSTTKETLS